MPRRDFGSPTSVIALARSAVARAHTALANEPDSALAWLERAHRLVPQDPNVRLSLASACLGRDPERAAALFAPIAEQHDVRQAWVGLAAAHLRMGRPEAARPSLAMALSRHVFVADIVALADQIAGAPGWCGMTSDGTVMPHPASAAPIEIRLDGQPVSDARLPRHWAHADRVDVSIGGQPALGSPIQIRAIRRTVGCVEIHAGGIRGWAWHPGDPDTPVALTLLHTATHHQQRVDAHREIVGIADTGPLARPRAFHLTRQQLMRLDGPIHIRGPDGKDLLGSPLDPAAEMADQRAAALRLGQLYPARSAGTGSSARSASTLTVDVPMADVPMADVPIADVPMADVPLADAPLPVAAGLKPRRRAVAIVVPVHNGADVATACLASVLASVSEDSRVIVVDDGSSDASLIATLDLLARQRKIRLLRQPRALGFPASANAGIIAAGRRDVLLLNSDTLVPGNGAPEAPGQVAAGAATGDGLGSSRPGRIGAAPGWVRRLRDAAYAAPDIGTVTPFSNDAAILSYPGDAGTNPLPDQAATDRLDRLAYRANGNEVVDIPVGVGFCLYLRRDCLDTVGVLRADIFAQGYGEENDFCLRARQLGWRSVALTGLFVGHHAGRSFGTAAGHLRNRNGRVLERLHPGHDRLIERFIAKDPLARARRRIDLLQWRGVGRRWQQSVILVAHNDGGGVEQRLAEAVRVHAAAGRRPIVLRPATAAGQSPAIAVRTGTTSDLPNLVYRMPDELPALRRLLLASRPVHVEVHHILDHPQQSLLDLVAGLGIPYDVHIHDYVWFCPRVTLLGGHDRYCGEPDLVDCEACVTDLGHFLNEEITVSVLRSRSAAFLAGARTVVTPSDDTGRRIRRHFDGISPVIIPHEDDAAIACTSGGLSFGPGPVTAGRLRVCIVGGLGIHKGYNIVLACGRDAARRDLALEFIVVGNTIDDDRLLATGRIFITGGFRSGQAVELIVAQHANFGFVPSVWPETWCLSLGDIWRAGLPAAAFDIGAPAERIRRTGRGFLLPLGLPASAVNDALVAAAGITRDV